MDVVEDVVAVADADVEDAVAGVGAVVAVGVERGKERERERGAERERERVRSLLCCVPRRRCAQRPMSVTIYHPRTSSHTSSLPLSHLLALH